MWNEFSTDPIKIDILRHERHKEYIIINQVNKSYKSTSIKKIQGNFIEEKLFPFNDNSPYLFPDQSIMGKMFHMWSLTEVL